MTKNEKIKEYKTVFRIFLEARSSIGAACCSPLLPIDTKDDLRKIGLLFNNIDNFNMILYKNNVLSIMIKQKEQPFEFNLQNEIDLNTIDLAKKCYLDVDKIISAMKGEFKDE